MKQWAALFKVVHGTDNQPRQPFNPEYCSTLYPENFEQYSDYLKTANGVRLMAVGTIDVARIVKVEVTPQASFELWIDRNLRRLRCTQNEEGVLWRSMPDEIKKKVAPKRV